jgi:hypothetical protein
VSEVGTGARDEGTGAFMYWKAAPLTLVRQAPSAWGCRADDCRPFAHPTKGCAVGSVSQFVAD